MSHMTRMFVFAAALALLVSFAGWHYDMGRPVQWAAALIICLVAWRLYYRKPSPPPSKDGKPLPGTRAYARMLYFNGIISMEELFEFYNTHPEVEDL